MEVNHVAPHTFTPRLEWLEGREAPAVLDGLLSGGSSSLLSALPVPALSLLSPSSPTTTAAPQTQNLAPATLTTPTLSIPALTLAPSLALPSTPALTLPALTVPTLTTPTTPALTSPSLTSPTLTQLAPTTPTLTTPTLPGTQSAPLGSFPSGSVTPASVSSVPGASSPAASPAAVAGPSLAGANGLTQGSFGTPAQPGTSNTTTGLLQNSALEAASLTAIPFSSVSAQATAVPVAQFTTPLAAVPPGLLVTSQTPVAIMTGPFQAGDTLTVAGTVNGTAGRILLGHEAETGPRVVTPNGGGDDNNELLLRPQVETQEGGAGADLIWPMLNPDGADPVLNFQPGRFEGFTDDDGSAATSDNGVVEAGLPWWSMVLLAVGSLAAGSLAVHPRGRRRREDLLVNPDESPR